MVLFVVVEALYDVFLLVKTRGCVYYRTLYKIWRLYFRKPVQQNAYTFLLFYMNKDQIKMITFLYNNFYLPCSLGYMWGLAFYSHVESPCMTKRGDLGPPNWCKHTIFFIEMSVPNKENERFICLWYRFGLFLWFFYWILELFRKWNICCFSFYFLSSKGLPYKTVILIYLNTCCACPMPGPIFPTPYMSWFFYVQ